MYIYEHLAMNAHVSSGVFTSPLLGLFGILCCFSNGCSSSFYCFFGLPSVFKCSIENQIVQCCYSSLFPLTSFITSCSRVGLENPCRCMYTKGVLNMYRYLLLLYSQMMSASLSLNPFSQIVPQALLTQSSTLPSKGLVPFTSRTSPSVQLASTVDGS